MSMADFLLTSREQKLLAAFLVDPDRTYSVSDLVRISGGHGATQNVINKLSDCGVIADERLGNQRRYRANKSFPLYPELRAICMKSFGLRERLQAALSPLADRIQQAFVFGSVAKGSDRGDSDVDLFIVGDVSLFEVSPIAAAVGHEIGREIHAQIYGADELAQLAGDKIVDGIMTGPRIDLINHAAAA